MDPLKEAIRRLAGPRPPIGADRRIRESDRDLSARPPVSAIPGCAFGLVVEQRLQELQRDLGEVKARVHGLLFLVAGAVVVEIVLRLVK